VDEARGRARKSARSAALNELARSHPHEFAAIYKRYRIAAGLEPDPLGATWDVVLGLIAGVCQDAGMLPGP
jgi:hypothetical protein